MSRGQTMYRALFALGAVFFAGEAAALECSTQFQIQQNFGNGAQWEMCFEEQQREGIVLRDISYTSPAGVKRRVLYQANLAQIHVPYDDDGARFHDVSDFGLGGARLNDLTQADCPGGTLVQNGSKDVICRSLQDAATLSTPNEVRYGEVFALFSVSHVGAYNYVPEWRFFDDGTIEPAMGATGRLQRYAASEDYGWPVRTGTSPVGVSHLHNYYWRLDFDLDGGDDDRFEELEFVDGPGGTRELRTSQFTTEAARSINANTQRFWRVFDAGTQSGSGRAISYDILPLETGHRDIGPTFEPWTFNDIYATNYRACERFISHNPADTAGGCVTNGDVSDFVNGESIASNGNDLVIWFGLTFHHTPRDEDEAFMNTHWNRFRLSPRDWLDVGSSNSNPVVVALVDRLDTVGDTVNFAATATDPDGDSLTFSAQGLPPGVSIAANGSITGTLTSSGTFAVSVTATDALAASDTESFVWNVQATGSCVGCVSFVTTATESYGGQDVASNVQVQDVGSTILLQDNTWRRTASSFDITPATVLAFEFSSSAQGEIHGIGFDADNTLTQNQMFQLWGTQTWGIQNFANYSPSAFVSYEIPVGTFYTGTGMRMVFVNDFDAGSGNISRFRNVRVFEASGNTAPVVSAVSNQSSVTGATVSLQLSGSDADGDALSWSATGLPQGLSIGANNGRVTGTPSTAGNNNVVVSAADPAGAVASVSFSWTVTNPTGNGAPTLAQPAAQSTTAGDTVNLALSATDPDGGALTYSATGLPAGLAINASSGAISGTPTTATLATVTATVTDNTGLSDSKSFNWTVTANVALSGTATQVSTLAVGLDLGAAKAIDGGTNGDFQAFTLSHTDLASEAWWEVDLGSSFELSRIEIFNRTDCCSEALQNFHVLVSDAPFTSTSLAATQSQPGVLDLAQTGIAPTQSTIALARRGRFVRIQLEAADYLQLAEVEIYGYPAAGGTNNFAPIVTNPGAQANLLGTNVNLQVVASDLENDPLSFGATGLPTGVDINAQTGLISGSPSVAGSYTVALEVSDGGSNTNLTFDWLITTSALPVNVAPGGIASQSSTLNIPVDLSAAQALDGNRDGNFGADSLSHTDFDNQPWWQVDLGARFTISRVDVFNREDCCSTALQDFYVLVSEQPFGNSSLTALLANSNVTAVQVAGVGGRPSDVAINTTGRYVRVQLSDADYLQLAEVEVLGVPADGGTTNLAPTLTSVADQTSNLGATVGLNLSTSDPEGDSLTFSATNLPPGLSIQASTGVISGTLTTGGVYNVVLAVSDGTSSTEAALVWTVIDPSAASNLAPGGTASQSSTLDLGLDFSADNAIDGERGGSFPTHAIAHSDIQAEPWWEIDLGQRYDLSQIVVFNREDCCAEALRDFHVFVSDVPFTSASVAGALAQGGVTSSFTAGPAGRETSIGVSRTGRYVRVQLTATEYLQLAEVEVYGSPL